MGEVTGNGADGLLIIWPDGEKFLVAPGDDDVAEFAAYLERDADEPLIIPDARPVVPAAGCSL